MKKYLLIAIITAAISSCKTLIAPPYTKVESIANIQHGMTASQVTSTIGIPPFDIYLMQKDGSTIIVYNYKIKERKNKGCNSVMIDFYKKEQNLTIGDSWYTTEAKLYVLFQSGKVSSMITSAGRKDAQNLLVANNTIRFVSETNRHLLLTEKLELGQQLVPLNSEGGFEDYTLNNTFGMLRELQTELFKELNKDKKSRNKKMIRKLEIKIWKEYRKSKRK